MSERIHVEVEGESTGQPPGGGGGGGGGGIMGGLMMLPGLGFIGLGVAIIMWPKLLEVLVASVFILIGLGLIFAARKVGHWRKKASAFSATFGGRM